MNLKNLIVPEGAAASLADSILKVCLCKGLTETILRDAKAVEEIRLNFGRENRLRILRHRRKRKMTPGAM